jgi:hypothetical protein
MPVVATSTAGVVPNAGHMHGFIAVQVPAATRERTKPRHDGNDCFGHYEHSIVGVLGDISVAGMRGCSASVCAPIIWYTLNAKLNPSRTRIASASWACGTGARPVS